MIDVKRWFRIQDLAWIIFVVILIATGPETNYQNLILEDLRLPTWPSRVDCLEDDL
jgi:hypothetical protein